MLNGKVFFLDLNFVSRRFLGVDVGFLKFLDFYITDVNEMVSVSLAFPR